MPWITHVIHSRLAERRAESGEEPRMDDFLTLLDSAWNGFYFEIPYSKKRMAIVRG